MRQRNLRVDRGGSWDYPTSEPFVLQFMNGHEFLRKLKKLANERTVQVVYEEAHGKGSHGAAFSARNPQL